MFSRLFERYSKSSHSSFVALVRSKGGLVLDLFNWRGVYGFIMLIFCRERERVVAKFWRSRLNPSSLWLLIM